MLVYILPHIGESVYESATAKDALGAILLGDVMRRVGENVTVRDMATRDRFAQVLASQRMAISGMTWVDIEKQIRAFDKDSRRPLVFPQMTWEWQLIDLRHCLVWPRMGERRWAVGSVEEVAIEANKISGTDDRILSMARLWAHLPFHELPVIAVHLNACRLPFGLDDGNHRAVSGFLSGMREVRALVGSGHPDYQMTFQEYKSIV